MGWIVADIGASILVISYLVLSVYFATVAGSLTAQQWPYILVALGMSGTCLWGAREQWRTLRRTYRGRR